MSEIDLEAKLHENNVPQAIIDFIGENGFIPTDDPLNVIYQRMRRGDCCTCSSPLDATTILLIQHDVVVAAFCGGPCMTDMQVMGWLTEQYDDMTQAITFRSGQGGN